VKPFVLTLSLTLALLLTNCSRAGQTPENARAVTHNKAYNTVYEKATEPSAAPRRLESVTWNSVRHELTWEVSKASEKKDSDSDGAYKPMAKDRYQIDMDNATMTFNGKTRRFSETEAANVRTLMDVIARYAVESTIWWEEGQGEPLDGDGQPAAPARPKTNDKPKTVGAPSQVVRLTGALEQLALLMAPPVPGASTQSR
jgi:hypothetical protein